MLVTVSFAMYRGSVNFFSNVMGTEKIAFQFPGGVKVQHKFPDTSTEHCTLLQSYNYVITLCVSSMTVSFPAAWMCDEEVSRCAGVD